MSQGKITEKQSEILAYIKDCILKKGYPPTVREICEKYFARFHDLHFTISRLRTEYAQGKLTE